MANCGIVCHTIEQTTEGVLICDSLGNSIRSKDLGELIRFLTADCGDNIRVVWNLDDAFWPIFKLLGLERCKRLVDKDFDNKCYIDGLGASMFFLKDKMLAIRQGRYEATYYQLEQYFRDALETPTMAQMTQMGRELLDAFHTMSLYPTPKVGLVSPANVYSKLMLSRADIPLMADFEEKYWPAFDMALETKGRTWNCAYKLGHFEAYNYDLTASFPWAATHLVDLRQLSFIEGAAPHPDAVYGFYRGRVNINKDANISPILKKDELDDERWLSPVGSWETTLSLGEWRFIDKWGIGTFESLEGWSLIPKQPRYPLNKPLKSMVYKLLEYKKQPGLVGTLAKAIAVGSFYGKFIEDIHEGGIPGKFYNPIWGVSVANTIRLKLADFIYQNKLDPIAVHTDAVLTETKLDIPPKAEPGGWKLDHSGNALVVSSEMTYFSTKRPGEISYTEAVKLIEDNPDAKIYTASIPRNVTLGMAVYGEFERLGERAIVPSSIDLTHRHRSTRRFVKYPKNGGELLVNKYDSQPILVGDKMPAPRMPKEAL